MGNILYFVNLAVNNPTGLVRFELRFGDTATLPASSTPTASLISEILFPSSGQAICMVHDMYGDDLSNEAFIQFCTEINASELPRGDISPAFELVKEGDFEYLNATLFGYMMKILLEDDDSFYSWVRDLSANGIVMPLEAVVVKGAFQKFQEPEVVPAVEETDHEPEETSWWLKIWQGAQVWFRDE